MAVNANIGTAWISVVPDTDKLAPAIKDALKDAEKSAVGSGSNMGQGLTSGINKTLKAGVVGAGLAAGGVLAASITKGLGRLSGIDNAQAKLSGLGHEAAAVEGIMDDALASVKGTAFGLEDAATIAASAVAAGIDPGKDLQRTLKLTGDAATIAGTDLSTMGSIVNKVATSDMMQMDVANQMMDAGIPILQMVGEELGVTAEEARKMASDGEISFETFQSALENGLGGAALKSGDTVQGAFANMQAAAGRFGAQLAAPVFNAAPEIFGALGGAFDQLGEKLEPLIEDFADWLAPRMEAFATETIPKLVDGVMGAVDAFIEFGGWVKDNAEWIKPLAAGIGGAVAAIYAWNTATTIATGVQTIFNKVIEANKLMLIVTAVAAVVAALVYFFTQTETGKAVWETFTNFLKSAWSSVSETFTSVWEWIKTNVFDAFGIKVQEVQIWWQNTTGQLKAAWQDVQMVFSAVWEAIKTAVFDAWNWYVNQVKANWEMVTSALNSAWTFVKDTFTSVWNAIKTAVFDAWNAYVNQVKANWDTVTNALNAAWTALKDHFTSIWNTIKTSVLDAWNTAVNFLKDTFNTITTTISDKWTWLKDQMSNVWSWIQSNVFDKFTSTLDVLKGAFETAVNAIGTAWGWLKAKTADPVNFVIREIYMNGVRRAWGAVASLVGLDDLPEIKEIGGFASGGILPGYTPGRDPYTFIEPTTGMSIGLSGGEAIMRPEATRALGSDWVDGVNAAARVGGRGGVEKYLGGFASGGVVPSIVNIVREKFPMMTVTSTYRNTNDHHGAGKAVDFSNGTDSTPAMRGAAQWFSENYGRSLLELIHSPSPFNIKNGQGVGDGFGFYGAGTMNAHRNHVHVAANEPLAGGGTGGVLGFLEGAVSSVADIAKSAWDGVINKIPSYDGGTGGKFAELPGAFLKKTAGAAWDFISEKAKSIGAFFGNPGAGVEQWRGLVESTLAAKGFSTDLADTVLRRMNQESGGDPRAINNWDSNATAGTPSKGLMQVIDPTFAAHKDPGFNDIWDPESNLRASMNYAVGRYGSLPAAYNRAGGYHDGGLAGRGQGWMKKTAMEPEMILSPATTQAFIDWMKGTPSGESVSVVAEEISAAFRGEDFGMGELASYVGLKNAEKILDEVEWLGTAQREVIDALNGIDSGVSGVGHFLGGNYELAAQIVAGVEVIGEVSRAVGAQLQKSGTDYATTQATGALDVMGLGGLVPLGQKLGAKAWDLYQASPYEVGFNGQSVTVEIEAESDADLIRVAEFKRLADQVHGLDVKVNQRPSAASITRGGVM